MVSFKIFSLEKRWQEAHDPRILQGYLVVVAVFYWSAFGYLQYFVLSNLSAFVLYGKFVFGVIYVTWGLANYLSPIGFLIALQYTCYILVGDYNPAYVPYEEGETDYSPV